MKTMSLFFFIRVAIIFVFANAAFAQEDTGYSFNKRPLGDFVARYKQDILDKNVNRNSPFKIELAGNLDNTGKLIEAKIKLKEGDPEMANIAIAAISALCDSGLFRPLYDLGARELIITLLQDKDNFHAIIRAPMSTAAQAKKMFNGLNLMISAAKMMRKGGDEEFLLQKTSLTDQDNSVIINFTMSQAEKNQLLDKHLKEEKAAS